MRSPTMWAAQSRAKLSMCTWNAWSSAASGVHAGAMCTLYAAALEPKQMPDHKTKRNRHVRPLNLCQPVRHSLQFFSLSKKLSFFSPSKSCTSCWVCLLYTSGVWIECAAICMHATNSVFAISTKCCIVCSFGKVILVDVYKRQAKCF